MQQEGCRKSGGSIDIFPQICDPQEYSLIELYTNNVA